MKPVTGKFACSKPNMQNLPLPKTEEGQRILAMAKAGWEERARARAAWIAKLLDGCEEEDDDEPES